MPRFRRFIFTILVICITGNVFSQSRQVPNLVNFDQSPYHFGFLLGINQMLFSVKMQPGYQNEWLNNIQNPALLPDQNSDSARMFSIESTPTYGFVIGIIGNLRVGKFFDLRATPSLSFGERNLHYSIDNYNGGVQSLLAVPKNIQSTFVEFPIWMRFKGARIHNVRPYILAGGKYTFDLASNAKKKDQSTTAHVFIDRNDIYAIGGVGFDFYTAYFKFGTELSMSYGLLDILKRDATAYTKNIESFRSKIFQISFTFE